MIGPPSGSVNARGTPAPIAQTSELVQGVEGVIDSTETRDSSSASAARSRGAFRPLPERRLSDFAGPAFPRGRARLRRERLVPASSRNRIARSAHQYGLGNARELRHVDPVGTVRASGGDRVEEYDLVPALLDAHGVIAEPWQGRFEIGQLVVVRREQRARLGPVRRGASRSRPRRDSIRRTCSFPAPHLIEQHETPVGRLTQDGGGFLHLDRRRWRLRARSDPRPPRA